MNYLQHPNFLVHFWSATNAEFEKIVDRFVRHEGWLFQDLGLAAKKANIGDIYRCVCTVVNRPYSKEDRLDHFWRVNFVILDCAKTQWLAPWRNYVIDPSKGVIPPFLKRQVGGFFLLYMLYISQPLANRFQRKQRIVMNAKDLIAMHVFNATMKRLPKSDAQFKELAKQLVTLFNDLVKSEAFEFSAVNDTFATPCQGVRQLLASKMCIFTKMVYTLKDLRDQLYFVTYNENTKLFRSLVAYGKYLPPKPQEKSKSPKKKGKGKSSTENVTDYFPKADKKWSVEEIKALENENDLGKLAHSVTSVLKSLDFGPILTRQRMTGISENLLDKEIDSHVTEYESHKKALEISAIQIRERRYHLGLGKKQRHWTILRKYCSGNYDWVDQVFRGEECAELPSFDNFLKPEEDPLLPDAVVDLGNSDEDDNEWMTDDESENDEAEFAIPLPPKKRFTPSPRKRNQPLSMPIIM